VSFHYHNRVRSYNRILLFLTAINLLYYWGQRRKTTSGNMWWKIDKREVMLRPEKLRPTPTWSRSKKFAPRRPTCLPSMTLRSSRNMKRFGRTSSRFGEITIHALCRSGVSRLRGLYSTTESVSVIAHNHNIIGGKSHGDFLTGSKKRLPLGVHCIGFKLSRHQLNFVFDKRSLVC
jgi:hypothetical protein